MAHSSNRERIARAAEEARLTKLEKAEKAAKPATKKPSSSGSKRVQKPVRMKIVWEVCTPTGTVAAVFAYPDKEAAEAKALALSRSSGRTHAIRGTKVPME